MRIVRLSAIALAIACAIVWAVCAQASAAERILRFGSDVTVERNGDLDVKETILVNAEQQSIRHGILRDFPTIYTRADGSRVVVVFDVKSVTLDGASVPWSTETMANGVRVRIGSANTMIGAGQHEFDIVYRTTRQIGFFASYDELYWNATGTGWTFPIDMVVASITLPDAVPFTQTAFYTGAQGAGGKAARIVTQQPGHIVFQTTGSLPPGNGLTVAAAWQKGVVTAPSSSQLANWWIEDNLPTAAAGFGLLGVLAYYLFAWRRVGRDPPRGTVIPLFGPPEGMSAAAVRYVENMSFDQRCFTAAIIDLGVNGQIKLTGTGKDTVIWKVDGGKPMPAPETALKSSLFGTKPSLALVQSNYESLTKAKQALHNGLEQSYGNRVFATNVGWSVIGIILVVAVLVLTAALTLTYPDDRAHAVMFAMWPPLIAIIPGAFMVRAGHRRDEGGGTLMTFGAALIAFGVLAGFGLLSVAGGSSVDVVPAIAAYILVPLAMLGVHWLEAPTVTGRATMDRIEGFRQYLGVAEEDRLNALNPPDKTPELFERFLPYALALDVENRWAQRFTAVLAAAGTSAATMTWYQGYRPGSDPVAFTSQLAGALSQTIASASSPPGSSEGGSSGGGFSGGGGGGGGGSGW